VENSKIAMWVLRIAVAGEFIGHGVFALQQKEGWIKYFTAFFFVQTILLSPHGLK